MKTVTKDQFYASIGQLNVHPHIMQGKYPYTTEWKTPSGKIVGKIIPEIGAYPHLFTEHYFLADHVDVGEKRESMETREPAKTKGRRPNLLDG